MKIKKDQELFKEIIEEYNENPEGWKASISGQGSRLNFYISKGKQLWHLKAEMIHPYKKIGIGGKTKIKKEIDHDFSFGWRPLTKKQMKKIVNELKKDGEVSDSTVKDLLEASPKSFFDIDEEYAFQGPIAFSNRPFRKLSKNQEKLDSKLTKELNKLVFYHGGSTYR
ncbi:MAG: hypothetical protein U9N35_01985 [Euryarchaeota archaeon]|nr:hypothetical protein [Euryarchaeota archaeon]